MFTQIETEIANKTSRANGAVGRNAIVPRKVREYLKACDEEITILDFGAGKTAAHAQALLEDGFDITAYEFGDNIDPRFHNELALTQQYDVVYASNVINTLSNLTMVETTIKQINSALKQTGAFFCNYPESPRKSDMSSKELKELLGCYFKSITIVGGTKNAPLILCKYY